jgi:sulfur-carrier protein
MANVWIPATMRAHTRGLDIVQVPGRTVREVITNLDASYPGMRDALLADGEKLRPGVAVAVDGYVAPLGLYQRVGEGSELQFIPAIGGG